jgi:hypothetical protein
MVNDKCELTVLRDNQNIITGYKCTIYRRDNQPMVVIVSREEAEELYGLYTYYGANLTARQVSQELPKWTLGEVKKLLRCFQVTKDSEWFPPHLNEELDEEQKADYRMQLKVRKAFKYADYRQERDYNKLINDFAVKFKELNDRTELCKEIFNREYKQEIWKPVTANNGTALVIYLSDMHIGAYNDAYGVYPNKYDKDEIERRMKKVFEQCLMKEYTQILVINLGDSIDNYDGYTARRDVKLPTILNNKEKVSLYSEIMNTFFYNLSMLGCPIYYWAIGESNHGGDYDWLANRLVGERAKRFGINVYISDYSIDNVTFNDVQFIFEHGKDNSNMLKAHPLIINDKTENYFNEYMLRSNMDFKMPTVVCKGDLHQSAITNAHWFQYHSCASLYGSSNYITANFGFTKWGCDFSEITNGTITNGLIHD